MADKKWGWESFKVEGAAILDTVTDIIREGNVRRVVVEHDGRTIAEFPLTAGVVGAVLAPMVAAIGALVALLITGRTARSMSSACPGTRPPNRPKGGSEPQRMSPESWGVPPPTSTVRRFRS